MEQAQLRIKNSKLRIAEGLTLVARLLVGGIFVLAGLAKLGMSSAMADSINTYSMPLPSWLVSTMADWLPALELGIGVWLIVGLFTRYAAAVSAVLLVIFTIAITQAWVRGLAINCGCFGGPNVSPAGKAVLDALGPVGTFLTHEAADLATIARDVVLLALAVLLVFVPTPFSVDALRRRSAANDVVYDEEEAYDDEVPEEPAHVKDGLTA